MRAACFVCLTCGAGHADMAGLQVGIPARPLELRLSLGNAAGKRKMETPERKVRMRLFCVYVWASG